MKAIYLAATALVLFSYPAGAQTGPAPGTTFTLNAAEAPTAKPWTDPASISYTKDAGSKAAIALAVAARLDWRLGDPTRSTNTAFVRGVINRDTTTGSQVESYSLEVGAHFEPNTVPRGSQDPNAFRNAWYFFNDLSAGFSYKTNFDDEKSACSTVPVPASCVRSHVSSLRVKWAVQPYNMSFEDTPSYVDGKATPDSPALAYSFGPVLTIFTDQAIDGKVVAGGVKRTGNVTGTVASFSLAVAPKFAGYRLVVRGAVQRTDALGRASNRAADFPRGSTLASIGADYNFGLRAFDSGPGWSPSLGVSYKNGDDPLSGKLDRDEFTIALKISYRPK